jgi:hypothetical protein
MGAPDHHPRARSRAWLRGAAAAIVVAVVALGCGGVQQQPRTGPGCDRITADDACGVLFLGNSYTAGNNLPSMIEELARSAGLHVTTGALTRGGTTLAEHLADPETASTLDDSTWNVVVLQEASMIPAAEDLRQTEMYPAGRELATQIRHADAQPLLFSTWAYSGGWPEVGLPAYATMQAAVDGGYATLAHELGTARAPVGAAWSEALRQMPDVPLWTEDGSHPSLYGSYLAACVLYGTILRRSPEGLDYHAGVPAPKAAQLQAIAWAAVAGPAGPPA